ncbi:N-glycosylase/DNA lyase [Thermococcus alcaliphilus]|uniref:N-glycosylase/DNA lyase n=1 Tax=Thermococcus alcaliphilus TaxID=139207 RepID=UPI0020912F95|nr:N-glycosylase/DNA lyase [Thermococcus alcaliphilus]MCO6041241.1 N-glycosylase/DNA lyase [Thermococcus alcaliphilus]
MKDERWYKVVEEVSRIFSEIPMDIWDRIVKEEPETKLGDQLERYGFGKFATFMVVAGLNDYQLKGPAEKVYWPKLHEILRKNPVPDTPKELYGILLPFYELERLKTAKVRRLEKFLHSDLATELWNSTPQEVARKFHQIWIQLSKIMGQRKDAKTIVFAMKTLGIALILAGEYGFDFSGIPIPVDIRVRRITSKLLGEQLDDDSIRKFWNSVLKKIRELNVPITMIHLDSLVWQIGNMDSCKDIKAYFEKFGILNIGDELCKIIENQRTT